MLVDLGPDRYAESLDVLRSGFATATSEFGITADNTPSNPAFWGEGSIAAVVAKGFSLFGVADHQQLLGCAFVGPSRDPLIWSLRHLAVIPAARHRGFGESLVAEAAQRAHAGGGRWLKIGIVAENARLSRWYQRLGFMTTDAGIQYPGLVFTVDHLELKL